MTGTQRIDLGLTDVNASCSCCSPTGAHGSHGKGDAHAAASTAPDAPAGALNAEYLVEGMTCGHCVSSVTEELGAVEGVQQVSVDLRPGAASVVTVTSAAPISDEAVRAAVEEAGYTLAAQGA